MEIHVRLFAGLRDCLPKEVRGAATIELTESANVVDVIEHFNIERRLAQMVLINGIQISRKLEERQSCTLTDGDTVSIFPPVAGG